MMSLVDRVPKGRPKVDDRKSVDIVRALADETKARKASLEARTAISGRVLVVAETALDATVQAAARSMADQGIETWVVVGPGAHGPRERHETGNVDGIPYQYLPGSQPVPTRLDQWLRQYAQGLASVVRKIRPSAVCVSGTTLHPEPVLAVAHAYGLTTVLDMRGVCEESSDSRRAWDHHLWTWVENSLAHSAIASPEDLGSIPSDARIITVDSDISRTTRAVIQILEETGAVETGFSAFCHARLPVDLKALFDPDDEMRSLERTLVEAESWSPERIIETGLWSHEGIDIDVSTAWADIIGDHRSVNWTLQAWIFMIPMIFAYERTGDPKYVRWCCERAIAWCKEVQDSKCQLSMTWYDMALGRRAPTLAYLFECAVRNDLLSDIEVRILGDSVFRHGREFLKGSVFNPAGNHGVFLAAGQVAFARRLSRLDGMKVLRELGDQRILTVSRTQFALDGGHREHSPEYHNMMVGVFAELIDSGIVEDPIVREQITRAAEVTGWLTRPDCTLEQIGDTRAKSLRRSILARRSTRLSQSARFVISEGKEGGAASNAVQILPHAGYGIVRAPVPHDTDSLRRASYLTMMAGFHSRIHKHADDLSLTWYDRGGEILIDAGRFGYGELLPEDSPDRMRGFYYSGAERQYCESTPAHNTVSADGRDHERRDRIPYGSALLGGAESNGTYTIAAQVDHGHWVHRRTIYLNPSCWLLVKDQVDSKDHEPHRFRVFWNLSERFTLDSSDDHSVGFRSGEGEDRLVISSLDSAVHEGPVFGGRDPLRGWRSRQDGEFIPCWHVPVASGHVKRHEFRTLLTYGEPSAADESLSLAAHLDAALTEEGVDPW